MLPPSVLENARVKEPEHSRLRHFQLTVSEECGFLVYTSFTQETQSWSWLMLPPWRPALARFKASAPKTPRTLSKLSERSVCCFICLVQCTVFYFYLISSVGSLCRFCLSVLVNMHLCLLFVFVQIPYLGFCACEEMGETGVWQLVDPPILPLTHGPNHSFNWREMLMQDWGMRSLALLVAVNCRRKLCILNPHCY